MGESMVSCRFSLKSTHWWGETPGPWTFPPWVSDVGVTPWHPEAPSRSDLPNGAGGCRGRLAAWGYDKMRIYVHAHVYVHIFLRPREVGKWWWSTLGFWGVAARVAEDLKDQLIWKSPLCLFRTWPSIWVGFERWIDFKGKITGKSHRNHGKIYGFRFRFYLEPTHWKDDSSQSFFFWGAAKDGNFPHLGTLGRRWDLWSGFWMRQEVLISIATSQPQWLPVVSHSTHSIFWGIRRFAPEKISPVKGQRLDPSRFEHVEDVSLW